MAKQESNLGITVKKSEDLSEWYTQVVQKAELADYTSVSGCMVLRPLAYSMWENIQTYFDKKIKAIGHKNCYFPLLIPEHLLNKEKEHVEGFSPEVAWVTHSGDTKLSERLAVRPTSETIMYESYSKWIRSYRDLPLLLNQWANIVRWEFKYPKPFLRTREFLWQEGHTAHATEQDADKEVMTILDIYTELIENLLAIPIIRGKKSDKEKFAGAIYTTTMEALMPDGKALQMGTSHALGQNFAKAFDITFLDKDEKKKHVWQTSWGITTRLIGAVIMVHGDDKGLVLPPSLAPVKAVVVPIIFKNKSEEVIKAANEIAKSLKFDVEVDARDDVSSGFKFHYWELQGVPLRIEVGPKDLEKKQAVIVRRDTSEKLFVPLKEINTQVKELLDKIQKNMFEKAKKFLDSNIVETEDWKEFMKAIKDKKMVKSSWCGAASCEDNIKEKTGGATSRLIPFNEKAKADKCVCCKEKANHIAYFAKSY